MGGAVQPALEKPVSHVPAGAPGRGGETGTIQE